MEHHAGDWTPSHYVGDGIAAGGGAHAGEGWKAGLQASELGDASRFDASGDVQRFAAGLDGRLNVLQAQTDRVIAQATHSPGYGDGVSPAAARALDGFGVASGIQAGVYQDEQGQQAQSDADNTMQASTEDVGDAQAAIDTPAAGTGE